MKFRSVGGLVVLMGACLSLGFAAPRDEPPLPGDPPPTCLWRWNGAMWGRVVIECYCPPGQDSFPPNHDGEGDQDYSVQPCWSDVMLVYQSPANRYVVRKPAGGPVFEVVPQQMPNVRK